MGITTPLEGKEFHQIRKTLPKTATFFRPEIFPSNLLTHSWDVSSGWGAPDSSHGRGKQLVVDVPFLRTPARASIEESLCICVLLACLVQLLVVISGCSEAQVPMQAAPRRAVCAEEAWFLIPVFGQVTSSVKWG